MLYRFPIFLTCWSKIISYLAVVSLKKEEEGNRERERERERERDFIHSKVLTQLFCTHTYSCFAFSVVFVFQCLFPFLRRSRQQYRSCLRQLLFHQQAKSVFTIHQAPCPSFQCIDCCMHFFSSLLSMKCQTEPPTPDRLHTMCL